MKKLSLGVLFFLCANLSGVSSWAEMTPKMDASAKPDAAVVSAEAWDHYYDKDFDQAVEGFKKEASIHSDWCDPYDGLGWSLMQKGDFKGAEENFKKSLKLYAYYPNSLAGMAEVTAWKYRESNRAWGAYYAGNFAKAIEIFNKILTEQTPRYPQSELWLVHNGIGWAHFANKDYDKAIEHFSESLKGKSGNSDTLKGLGFSHYEKGNWDEAMTQLQTSLKAFNYQPDVVSKIAWIHNKKGDFKSAIEQFEKAKKLNPYLVDPYRGLAWTYLDMKDDKKAKEAFIQGIRIYPGYVADAKFKEILKSRPDWNDIYLVLGWSDYYYGLYQMAADDFEDALGVLPDDAGILRGAGYAHYKLGNYDKAMNFLKKSFAKNPDLEPVEEYVQIPGTIAIYPIKSDAQSTMAWALYLQKKYDEAVATFQEAAQRHPNWIDVHDGLGWTYFMMKDYKNAEKSFKDALSFDPGYADALNGIYAIEQVKYGKSGLGWSYYYYGDYKTALKQFNEVLGSKSEFPKEQLWSIHSGMGWCHYWLGDYSKAENEFRQVLGEKSDNVDALVGLGYVLFQRKNYEEAIGNLEKSLKAAPGNYQALTTLGWSYYKIGDAPKAIDTFKKANAVNIYLVDPYFGLGLSYYKNKNLKEAKEALGTAIDIYPDYVMTDEFKEILSKEADWLDLTSRLGWSYTYKGAYDKASDKFAEVLKKDPTSKDALLGLGSIYFQQGDYKSTIAKLEPLLADKPAKEKGWYKWSYVLKNLGWSHYYGGNYDKALEYFKQLAQLHQDDDIYAEPYSGIGWCLLKRGDKSNSREQFLKAVKMFPGYLSAVSGLSELDRGK